jgi:hypothetical protein
MARVHFQARPKKLSRDTLQVVGIHQLMAPPLPEAAIVAPGLHRGHGSALAVAGCIPTLSSRTVLMLLSALIGTSRRL